MNMKRRIAALEEYTDDKSVAPPPEIWFRDGDTYSRGDGESITAEEFNARTHAVHTIIIEADDE